ncbi:hypothetical protein [Bacillus suaedae]|uniref:Uncharacterized protein n=1 Tax=Halalkalibacter suaedae TaxID=2822140 RepID=A0A941ANS7_9BACI|nr:hypothetical protein [Bacillus suaedae]MBP3951116.1 hypothetical protein [Bacillus suaedae]
MLTVNTRGNTGLIHTDDHFIIIVNGKMTERFEFTIENIDAALTVLNKSMKSNEKV